MYRKILAASIISAALVGLTACVSPTAATKTSASDYDSPRSGEVHRASGP
jgi:hypothetical protein